MTHSDYATNQEVPPLIVLLPSLRISGGVQETLRLAAALAQRGVPVRILVIWKHAHEVPTHGLPVDYLSSFVPRRSQATLQFPLLLASYLVYIRRAKKNSPSPPALLLTHYSTYPFAWLSPAIKRFCFTQDIEWMFVPRGIVRWIIRHLILSTMRRSLVVTANAFLSHHFFEIEKIRPFAQASIWASERWLPPIVNPTAQRSVDIVLMLRPAPIKRLDLYLDLIRQIEEKTTWTYAVITPEDDLAIRFPQSAGMLLRPSLEQTRALYMGSRVFVLLSDIEGFGLPPLEAMASGCVPLCRDSGGVHCYMQGPLAANLVDPRATISDILLRLNALLGDPDKLARLSSAARTVFTEGLRQTNAERELCFDHIALRLVDRSVEPMTSG